MLATGEIPMYIVDLLRCPDLENVAVPSNLSRMLFMMNSTEDSEIYQSPLRTK